MAKYTLRVNRRTDLGYVELEISSDNRIEVLDQLDDVIRILRDIVDLKVV